MSFKLTVGVLGGYVAYILGGWDTLLKTLVILSAIDYLTGVMVAIFKGKLCSKTGYKGIIKKICMFCIVALASIVDMTVNTQLIRNITIMFYISNEGISILENVGRTGVKYPKKLKDMLKQLNKERD